nr:carbohydrate ABC transporter permease [Clostridia bacterium]
MRVSLGRRAFTVVNALFMVMMVFFCVVPFLHVLFASVSDPAYIAQRRGVILFPVGINVEGYKLVLRNPNIVQGYLNTFFYTGVGTLISIALTSLGAYVLSRQGVLWMPVLMKLITFTMFFSGGLIPFFLVVNGIGLMNTRWAVILPYAISAWNLIIMRSSFKALPSSLEESARIDGANDIVILVCIVLPLSLPVLSVMVLFYAINYWNSWFPAVIFLQRRNLFPLQLLLREVLIQNDITKIAAIADLEELESEFYRDLTKYTTIMVATLPIIFVYPFLQKYFIKGLMVGSIKE